MARRRAAAAGCTAVGLRRLCALTPAALGFALLLRLGRPAFTLGAQRGCSGALRQRPSAHRPHVRCRAAGELALKVDGAVEPLGAHVLVKLPEQEEEVTKGGLLLPSRRERPRFGEVVSVGPGLAARGTGEARPLELQAGDQVLYGRYAKAAPLELAGSEYVLVKAEDVLCSFRGGGADLSSVQMLRGKVLVKLLEAKEETREGLFLATSGEEAQTKLGEVVAVGAPEPLDDGGELAPPVKVGDMVRIGYGQDVELDGDEARYRAVHFSRVFARWKEVA